MLWGLLAGALLVVFMLMVLRWSQQRWRDADRLREVDLTAVAEKVTIDLGTLEGVPSAAPAIASVRWTKLQAHNQGSSRAAGVVVYGPLRLTWAPDDAARSFGVSTWQLPWADIVGASVRTGTQTRPAVLTLTLSSGVEVELSGVNETEALKAVRRAAGHAELTEREPNSEAE